MAKQFAQQVKESGKTPEEMKARIMLRGCYGVAEEWHRGVDTVKRYATDELEMPNPPVFGKDECKNTDTLRHEFMLEMYSFCKELEEQNERLRTVIAERDEEDRKREAIKHLNYINLLDDVKTRRAQFKTQMGNS